MTLSSRIFAYIFGFIFLLILIAKGLTIWTDYLWFDVMGQATVFSTVLWTRVKLGLVVGVLFFVWIWPNLRFARKPLPSDVTLIGKRLLPDEERKQIEEYADRAILIFSLVGGLMAGLVASGKWLPWLQYTHGVDFGDADPLFGKDAGFYVFKLALLKYAWRSAFYGVIIAAVGSLLVHIYQEAIRIVGNTVQTIGRARAHIYSLVSLALILKVIGYRLDQFGLLLANRGGVFSGASYADVHGRLPVMYALMALCLIGAGIILVNIRSRRLFWPAGALAVILLFSLLGGTVYPSLVQKLVVLPTQLEMEREFIEHNIKATNKAFALNDIGDEIHRVRGELTWEVVENNRATIDNIRLWDHRPLEATMDMTQAVRAYYDFPDVDVDRYTVNGQYRQVMIAPRQIDSNKIPGEKTWVKDRLKYTHGYGVCAVPVNEIGGAQGEGRPNYWVENIPPESIEGMEIDRPGIYFYASIHPRLIEIIQKINRRERAGEPEAPPPSGGDEEGAVSDRPGAEEQRVMDEPLAKIEDFVIVNTDEPELDYQGLAEDSPGMTVTKYTGRSGVPVGGFFRRLAFFARFHDLQVLLTQSINKDSKVILNRTLPERLQELCPSLFLICDPDPYITVIDGKLLWITDAYTHSRSYPYSTPHRLVMGINYMRNSVKVTCDAYDGIPTFYVVDKSDPMIQCYQTMFPTLFTDAPMPEPVREHIRYPQLQFIVQAEMYADYHMLDASTFYQREDSWAIAPELYGTQTRTTEAYYVVMKLPGEEKEEFLLMVPFTLRGREERNMVAWLAARCDGDHYGELICYKMPSGSPVHGSRMIESRIGQNKEFAEKQTLWSQHGSTVIRGNLLVIPIEDTFLYVEPIYIAASQKPIPELKLVILVSGDRVALGTDLDDALHKLLGGPLTRKAPAPAEPGAKPVKPEPTTLDIPASVVETIQRAIGIETQMNQALGRGDLAEYQRLHREQLKLMEQALKAAE